VYKPSRKALEPVRKQHGEQYQENTAHRHPRGGDHDGMREPTVNLNKPHKKESKEYREIEQAFEHKRGHHRYGRDVEMTPKPYCPQHITGAKGKHIIDCDAR
jgi:hypothetical protein